MVIRRKALRFTVLRLDGLAMAKHKTTVLIEEQLWKNLVIYVTQKYGSSRKVSEEVEKAVEEYLSRHK